MSRPRYPSDAKGSAYTRAYRDKHPGAIQVAKAKMKARRLGLVADLTVAIWERIVEEYEHCCAYCLTHESQAPYVTAPGFGLGLDHIIPLAKGGGTTEANVVPACYACNLAKGTKGGDFNPSIASRLWPFHATLQSVEEALKA